MMPWGATVTAPVGCLGSLIAEHDHASWTVATHTSSYSLCHKLGRRLRIDWQHVVMAL